MIFKCKGFLRPRRWGLFRALSVDGAIKNPFAMIILTFKFEILSAYLKVLNDWILYEQYDDPLINDFTYFPSLRCRYIVEHVHDNVFWHYNLDDPHYRLKVRLTWEPPTTENKSATARRHLQ